MCDTFKAVIDTENINNLPAYITKILDDEKASLRKLIEIRGFSRCSQDGMILYDEYTIAFKSSNSLMVIYKVIKWHNSFQDDPIINSLYFEIDDFNRWVSKAKEISIYE